MIVRLVDIIYPSVKGRGGSPDRPELGDLLIAMFPVIAIGRIRGGGGVR